MQAIQLTRRANHHHLPKLIVTNIKVTITSQSLEDRLVTLIHCFSPLQLLLLPDFMSESAYYVEEAANGLTSLLEECLPYSLAQAGVREECRDIAFSLSVEFYGQVFGELACVSNEVARQSKQVNYIHPGQLFFSKEKSCPGWDSNPQRSAVSVSALPTELPAIFFIHRV